MLGGELFRELDEFVVEIFYRVVRLVAVVFPIGIKPRYPGKRHLGPAGKVEGKTAGYATLGAAEVAVEKTLGIQEHLNAAACLAWGRAAEGAGRLQGVIVELGLRQVLEVKAADRIRCVHVFFP